MHVSIVVRYSFFLTVMLSALRDGRRTEYTPLGSPIVPDPRVAACNRGNVDGDDDTGFVGGIHAVGRMLGACVLAFDPRSGCCQEGGCHDRSDRLHDSTPRQKDQARSDFTGGCIFRTSTAKQNRQHLPIYSNDVQSMQLIVPTNQQRRYLSFFCVQCTEKTNKQAASRPDFLGILL